MSPQKFRPLVALTLALVFCLSNVAQAMSGRPLSSAAAGLDFTLRTADGGEISSEMLRGDIVVLAFGATWLPSLTRKQVEGVQKLADQYADRDVRVYWVSIDSDQPKSKNYASDGQLRSFAERNGLKVAVLRDPGGALLKKIGSDQLPAVVVLDRQGNVSGTPIGGFDPRANFADLVAPRINRLLEQ